MWGGAAETLGVCAICIAAASIRAPGRRAGQSQQPPPLVTLTGEARPSTRARSPIPHGVVPRACSPVHLRSGVGLTLVKAFASLGEKMEFLHLP